MRDLTGMTLGVWVGGGMASALFASLIAGFSHLSRDAALPWFGYALAAAMFTVGVWMIWQPKPLVLWESYASLASVFGAWYLALNVFSYGTAILIASGVTLLVFLTEFWFTYALFLVIGGIGLAMNVARWSMDLALIAGCGVVSFGYLRWKEPDGADEQLATYLKQYLIFPCIVFPVSRSDAAVSLTRMSQLNVIGLGAMLPLWIVCAWLGKAAPHMGILESVGALGLVALVRRLTNRWSAAALLTTCTFLSFAGMRILSHVW